MTNYRDRFQNKTPKKLNTATEASRVLPKVNEAELKSEAESQRYISAYFKQQSRYIPEIDYKNPSTFAFFGSAEKYYEDSIKSIYNTYPYDGSRAEKAEWSLEASYLDLYLLEHEYPKETGHIIFSRDGDTITADPNGYPITDNPQYVKFFGGPQKNTVYNTSQNREGNIKIDGTPGNTIEFWLKKESNSWSATLGDKEVIFDVCSSNDSDPLKTARMTVELDQTNLSPFLFTYMSGTTGANQLRLGASTVTTSSVADGNWHHYAFTAITSGSSTVYKFYIDGTLNDTQTEAHVVGENTSQMIGAIGSLRKENQNTHGDLGQGKLDASIDEVRFWKKHRDEKEIGRFWYNPVHGGTDGDHTNAALGLYYKFNEGVTGEEEFDKVVLDYSGRINNGEIVGWEAPMRSLDSGITLATAVPEEDFAELGDPILNPSNSKITSLVTRFENIGRSHDANNKASLSNSVPQYFIDEGDETFLNLLQIMSSAFDDLFLKIKFLPKMKEYSSREFFKEQGSYRQSQNNSFLIGCEEVTLKEFTGHHAKPWVSNTLEHFGIVSSDIFQDASLFERFINRTEEANFEHNLEEVKKFILANIHSNLVHILKKKGTEEGFRNLIRCFGIDDELVKLNTYGDNEVYELVTKPIYTAIKHKSINFEGQNFQGTIHQTSSASDSTTKGYIEATTALTPFTMEGNFIFPKYDPRTSVALNTVSLFGMHTVEGSANPSDPLTVSTPDAAGLQVRVKKNDHASSAAYFELTSSGGIITALTSSHFPDVYENEHWNISVRIGAKEAIDFNVVTPSEYLIEFTGYNYDLDVEKNSFYLTASITPAQYQAISQTDKAMFVGAHKTNFTGSTLVSTDVHVLGFNAWKDVLSEDELKEHAQNPKVFGRKKPQSISNFDTGTNTLALDSLLFRWQFEAHEESSVGGTISIEDLSSGFGDDVTGFKYLGHATGLVNQSTAIEQEFLAAVEYFGLDNTYSSDRVKIKTLELEKFKADSRPTTHNFTFEKSMYQIISKEMVNFFAGIVGLGTIIGEPVNKYRKKYKLLEKVRNRFFARVENVPDIDKFIEYYKWIDSSLSVFLEQLVPASSFLSARIRDVVESHVLERNKYEHKAPTVEFKDPSESPSSVFGIGELLYNWKFGHGISNYEIPINQKAIQFIANGDTVDIPDDDTMSFTDGNGTDRPFSISAWVKPANIATDSGVIISRRNSAGIGIEDGEWMLQHVNGGIEVILYADPLQNGIGGFSTVNRIIFRDQGTKLTSNTWNHVVATYAGNQDINDIKVYLNGSEIIPTHVNGAREKNNYSGMPNFNITTTIGGTDNPTTNTFEDQIADVVIFDKDLTSLEVTELYAGGKVIDISNHSAWNNVVSWWRMGDYQDTSDPAGILDYKGTNHGTLVGTATIEDVSLTDLPSDTDFKQSSNENCLWVKERAEVSPEREVIKRVTHTEVSGSTYATRRLVKPYRLEADNVVTTSTGFNRDAAKLVNPFTIINSGKNVTLDGATITDQDKCPDVLDPTVKEVYRGLTDVTGTNGYLDGDSDLVLPFNLMSSSAGTDLPGLKDNLKVSNNHLTLDITGEKPLQGPFGETHIAGMPHRKVHFGTANNHRAEAYTLTVTNGILTMSAPPTDTPKSMFFRDVSGTRFANISNINHDTGSLVLGNYSNDYQVVMINGRSLNNNYFIDNSGDWVNQFTQSADIDGVVNYEVPDRGKTEHVIVNRFSSPGGPETAAAFGMDIESEEYSIYNTVNYRNATVRDVLNLLHSERSDQFGLRAGSSTQASVHMTNRNTIRTTGSGGDQVDYDNFFVQRPLPSNDFGYSWIKASADESGQGEDVYSFLLKNDNFGYQHKFSNQSGIKSSQTINFVTSSELTPNSNLSFGNWDANASYNTSSNTLEYASSVELNTQITNKQGTYGWPTWKQIRGNEHPGSRWERTNAKMTLVVGKNAVTGTEYLFPKTRQSYEWSTNKNLYKVDLGGTAVIEKILETYDEVMTTNRFNPLTITLHGGRAGDLSTSPISQKSMEIYWNRDETSLTSLQNDAARVAQNPFDIGTRLASIKVSAGNQVTTFANPSLSNRLKIDDIMMLENVSDIIEALAEVSLEDEDVFATEINYIETLYPREVNTFTKESRIRELFDFFSWRDNRSDREIILEGSIVNHVGSQDSDKVGLLANKDGASFVFNGTTSFVEVPDNDALSPQTASISDITVKSFESNSLTRISTPDSIDHTFVATATPRPVTASAFNGTSSKVVLSQNNGFSYIQPDTSNSSIASFNTNSFYTVSDNDQYSLVARSGSQTNQGYARFLGWQSATDDNTLTASNPASGGTKDFSMIDQSSTNECSYSVMFYIKTAETTVGQAGIVGKGNNSSNGREWYVSQRGRKITLTTRDQTNQTNVEYIPTGSILNNSSSITQPWQHIALTYDVSDAGQASQTLTITNVNNINGLTPDNTTDVIRIRKDLKSDDFFKVTFNSAINEASSTWDSGTQTLTVGTSGTSSTSTIASRIQNQISNVFGSSIGHRFQISRTNNALTFTMGDRGPIRGIGASFTTSGGNIVYSNTLLDGFNSDNGYTIGTISDGAFAVVKLYKNGALFETITEPSATASSYEYGSMTATTGPLVVGDTPWTGNNPINQLTDFKGWLSNLVLYKHDGRSPDVHNRETSVLSSFDVARLYNDGFVFDYQSNNRYRDMVAWYKFSNTNIFPAGGFSTVPNEMSSIITTTALSPRQGSSSTTPEPVASSTASTIKEQEKAFRSFVISFWIYPHEHTNSSKRMILSKGDEWLVYKEGSSIKFRLYDSSLYDSGKTNFNFVDFGISNGMITSSSTGNTVATHVVIRGYMSAAGRIDIDFYKNGTLSQSSHYTVSSGNSNVFIAGNGLQNLRPLNTGDSVKIGHPDRTIPNTSGINRTALTGFDGSLTYLAFFVDDDNTIEWSDQLIGELRSINSTIGVSKYDYRRHPMASQLTSFWKLDTSGTITDVLGLSNAVPASSPDTPSTFGPDLEVSVKDYEDVSFSLSAWVKFNSDAGAIISKADQTSLDPLTSKLEWTLETTSNGNLQLVLFDDRPIIPNNTTSRAFVEKTFFNTNTLSTGWNHIAVVYKAATDEVDFYINAVKNTNSLPSETGVGTTSSYTSMTLTSTEVIFGAEKAAAAGNTNRLDGSLYNVVIYNAGKELSQTEVNELYNTGNAWEIRQASTWSDMLSYYKMNNVSLVDVKGNSTATATSITTAADSGLNIVQDEDRSFTMAFWYKKDFTASTSEILGKWGTSTADQEYKLNQAGRGLKLSLRDSSGTDNQAVTSEFTSSTTILSTSTNAWEHIVVTYNASTRKVDFYVDAVRDGSTGFTGTNSSDYFEMQDGTAPFVLGQATSLTLPTTGVGADMSHLVIYKHAEGVAPFDATEVTELYNEGYVYDYNEHSREADMVLWLKLDDATGTAHADSSGLSHNSTSNTSLAAITQSALQFREYVTTPITICAWIKVDTLTGLKMLATKYIDPQTAEFDFSVSSQKLRLAVYDNDATSDSTVFESSDVITAVDTWYHVAVTFTPSQTSDGGDVVFYVNGVPETVTTGSSTGNFDHPIKNTTAPFKIGARMNPEQDFFDGNISRVLLYLTEPTAGPLTTQQVETIYSLGFCYEDSELPRASEITGYWKLDDQSSPTGSVIDDSGNGFDGTATDAALDETSSPEKLAYFYKIEEQDRFDYRRTNGFGTDFVNVDSGSPIDADPNHITASRWPLDARKDFTARPLDLSTSSFNSTGTDQCFTYVANNHATRGEGILQNDYSIFGCGANFQFALPPAAPVYSRRVPQTVGSNEYLAGEAEWKVGEQLGINPFDTDFEKHATNFRQLGQDHSLVPEFIVSNHVEDIVLNNRGQYTQISDREEFLTVTGAVYHKSSGNLQVAEKFYKTYGISDMMKYFGVTMEEVENNDLGSPTKITLRCKAAIKFTPYRGFYPAERVQQITEMFSRGYLPEFEFETVDTTPAFVQDQETLLKTKIRANLQQSIKPLFAPGVLMNSIKSGMAVDYPLFTADNVSAQITSGSDGEGYQKLEITGSSEVVIGPNSLSITSNNLYVGDNNYNSSEGRVTIFRRDAAGNTYTGTNKYTFVRDRLNPDSTDVGFGHSTFASDIYLAVGVKDSFAQASTSQGISSFSNPQGKIYLWALGSASGDPGSGSPDAEIENPDDPRYNCTSFNQGATCTIGSANDTLSTQEFANNVKIYNKYLFTTAVLRIDDGNLADNRRFYVWKSGYKASGTDTVGFVGVTGEDVYQRIENPDYTHDDTFGASFDFSPDTETLVISSTGADSNATHEGKVYIYGVSSSGQFSVTQTIVPPEGFLEENSDFGTSVSITPNGRYLAIGQRTNQTSAGFNLSTAGAVHIYEKISNQFSLKQTILNPAANPIYQNFGYNIDLNDNYMLVQTRILFLGADTGETLSYLYYNNNSTGEWILASQIAKDLEDTNPTPTSISGFTRGTIDKEGNNIALGAYELSQGDNTKKTVLAASFTGDSVDNYDIVKRQVPSPASSFSTVLASINNFTGSIINNTTDVGIPRLKGDTYKRVTFEEMMNPDTLKGLGIEDQEPHPSASTYHADKYTGKVMDFPFKFGELDATNNEIDLGVSSFTPKQSLSTTMKPYRLAINNFCAETINFFLQDGKTATLETKKAASPELKKDQTYKMRIEVLNNGIRMYDRHSAFGPAVDEGTIKLLEDGTEVNVTASHAHSPFVPPFLDPNASPYVDISFTATEDKKYTLEEILQGAVYDYSNFKVAPSNADENTNYKHAMSLSASLKLDGLVVYLPEENIDAGTTIEGRSRWVIQPRWETPVLDFSNATGSALDLNSNQTVTVEATKDNTPWQRRNWDNFYTNKPKASGLNYLTSSIGMWHQAGTLPKSENGGYTIRIQPHPDVSNPDLQLATKVGFIEEKEAITAEVGKIRDRKVVYEAVVAIPFIEPADRNSSIKYFDLPQDVMSAAGLTNKSKKEDLRTGIITPEEYERWFNTPGQAKKDAIGYQMRMFDKYVIPEDFKGKMMYVFQFSAEFTRDDLYRIWQNVSPTSDFSGKDLRYSTVDNDQGISGISQDVQYVSNFLGDLGPTVNPMSFEKDKIRWVVLKVKQRASFDLNEIKKESLVGYSEGSRIDTTKGTFNPTQELRNQKYSFNWPYDFFSIVELVKLEGKVDIFNGISPIEPPPSSEE